MTLARLLGVEVDRNQVAIDSASVRSAGRSPPARWRTIVAVTPLLFGKSRAITASAWRASADAGRASAKPGGGAGYFCARTVRATAATAQTARTSRPRAWL